MDNAKAVLGQPSVLTQTSVRQPNKPDTISNNGAAPLKEGIVHPLAAAPAPGLRSDPPGRQFPGDGRSLSDDFQRMLAAKESGTPEEEDVPMWDAVKKENPEPAEVPPQVERVLSVIPGTIIN
jgi:hypothetical protein